MPPLVVGDPMSPATPALPPPTPPPSPAPAARAAQIVKMQEDPSTVPEGETPRALLLYAFDTNVDAVKPGDKVTITGGRGGICVCGRGGGHMDAGI